MCTLIVLHRPDPAVPLVVAANRDEYLDRPAAGPALARTRGVRILAPRDLRAGGTWLGISERGVFAALTNRPCADPDRSRRSRGLLVHDALGAPDAEKAAARLEAAGAGAYNPFNLLVSDGRRAFVCVYEGAPRVTELAPGPHLLGNADPDDRSVPKVAHLLEAAERIAQGPRERYLDALAEVCRGHDGHEGGGPLAPACIHHDTAGYGTRSSTLLRLDADSRASELRFADGPPCRTNYDDVSPLLHGLLSGRPVGGEATVRSLD
jgi:uncharacterized protein with NRDE domain